MPGRKLTRVATTNNRSLTFVHREVYDLPYVEGFALLSVTPVQAFSEGVVANQDNRCNEIK